MWPYLQGENFTHSMYSCSHNVQWVFATQASVSVSQFYIPVAVPFSKVMSTKTGMSLVPSLVRVREIFESASLTTEIVELKPIVTAVCVCVCMEKLYCLNTACYHFGFFSFHHSTLTLPSLSSMRTLATTPSVVTPPSGPGTSTPKKPSVAS